MIGKGGHCTMSGRDRAFEMEEGLEFLLARVGKAHRDLVRQSLHGSGLHRGQPMLLRAVHKQGGMTHSELAEKLEVSPPTITNMVKRMERHGLVERRRDDADERISRVFLTEEGEELMAKIQPLAQQIDDTAFAGFSAEERQQIRELLGRVLSNLQKAVREGGGPHRRRGRRPRGGRPRREHGRKRTPRWRSVQQSNESNG